MSAVDVTSDVEADFFNLLELDIDVQSQLSQIDSRGEKNFIGFQIPSTNISIIKSLGYFYNSRLKFFKLVNEVLNQEISGVGSDLAR